MGFCLESDLADTPDAQAKCAAVCGLILNCGEMAANNFYGIAKTVENRKVFA